MENTREEDFPCWFYWFFFWSSSIPFSEKSDPGKPAAPQKAVVFSLTPCYPPAHSFPPADNVHGRSFSPRNWPLFAINLAIKAFSGKHVPEFTILCGHEGSGPLILAKRSLKSPDSDAEVTVPEDA